MSFFGSCRARGVLCACLALACLGPAPCRAAEDVVSVAIEACGAMAPQTGETDVPRPARMVRPDGTVLPGDAGLGCRFTVRGGQRGKPEVVEARLSRPALTGQGQAMDRWYILARRGETAVAEHVFPERGQALDGTWTLELFIAGRLVAEKPFQVKTGRDTAASAVPAPPATASAVPATPAVASVAAPTRAATPVAAATTAAAPVAPTTSTAASAAPTTSATASAVPTMSATAPGAAAMSAAAEATPAVPTAPGQAPSPSLAAQGVVAPPAMPPAPEPDRGAGTVRMRRPQLPAEEPLPRAVARNHQVAKASPPAAASVRPKPSPPAPKTAALPAATKTSGRTAPPAPRAASSATPPAPAAPPATGYFALQTGVFTDPGNAQGQAARLRTHGFPACVAEEKGPDGKRYRVLAGRFGDRRTAIALRGEIATAVGGAKAVPQAVDPATASRLRCR